jgi:hypothetical protein
MTKERWWIIFLLAALALAVISPIASAWPDGLERVAEDLGFIEQAQDAPYEIIPDYTFPGVGNEALSTVVAGIVGTLVVFAVMWGFAAMMRRRGGQTS